jgi:hypothetical protein
VTTALGHNCREGSTRVDEKKMRLNYIPGRKNVLSCINKFKSLGDDPCLNGV